LQLKFSEKIILAAVGSFAKKKTGSFSLQENADFEKSLTAWIEIESKDKAQFPKKESKSLAEINNVTGKKEETIRGDPVADFDRQQALTFCRNAPNKQSNLYQQMLFKWKFTPEELTA
jgi:hypothetical protein